MRRMWLCCPVIGWRSVQRIPSLLPGGSCERLHHPPGTSNSVKAVMENLYTELNFHLRWLGGQHCCLTARRFLVWTSAGAFLCWYCMFSPSLHGFPLGTLASSHNPKTCMFVQLPIRVIVSVHGCSSTCGPVMDWRPVQGVPLLFPEESWNRLQQIPAGPAGMDNEWINFHFSHKIPTYAECIMFETIWFEFSETFVHGISNCSMKTSFLTLLDYLIYCS